MIDNINKKILYTLSRDSRASIEKVAEATNISATPVRRRIKIMESEGIIEAYTISVNMKKCGYNLCLFVFIKLQSRDQNTIADFESRVRSLPEIVSCNLVSGAHDYVLQLYVPDMETYNRFLRVALSELPGVFGIETSVVISNLKQQVPLPI